MTSTRCERCEAGYRILRWQVSDVHGAHGRGASFFSGAGLRSERHACREVVTVRKGRGREGDSCRRLRRTGISRRPSHSCHCGSVLSLSYSCCSRAVAGHPAAVGIRIPDRRRQSTLCVRHSLPRLLAEDFGPLCVLRWPRDVVGALDWPAQLSACSDISVAAIVHLSV